MDSYLFEVVDDDRWQGSIGNNLFDITKVRLHTISPLLITPRRESLSGIEVMECCCLTWWEHGPNCKIYERWWITIDEKHTKDISGPSSSSVVTWAINAKFFTNPQDSPTGVSHGQSIPHCTRQQYINKSWTIKLLNNSRTQNDREIVNDLAWMQSTWSTNFPWLLKLWLNFCKKT